MSGEVTVNVPKGATSAKIRTPRMSKAPRSAASPATLALKDSKMNDSVKAFAAKAQEQAGVTIEKSKKATEDMVAFGKGNVEAIIESSRIAAKGIETMGQDAASYAKSSYETTAAALKSMSGVTSPTELMRLQADFFRTSFDAMVKQASRSTEATLKLAGEVAQPIQNRVALAADKLKVAA